MDIFVLSLFSHSKIVFLLLLQSHITLTSSFLSGASDQAAYYHFSGLLSTDFFEWDCLHVGLFCLRGNFLGWNRLQGEAEVCEYFFSSAVADSCKFGGLNKGRNYIFHREIFLGDHLNEIGFDGLSDFPISIDLELIRVIDGC